MSAKKSAAAEQAAATATDARYDVTLSRPIEILGFRYMPAHHHTVDQSIHDEMNAAGVIADVKQLS